MNGLNREYECLVSVLCTTYNHEKYIRQCLDSMVSQKTDFPFEIIVRDDCSTDSTGSIIREYGEKYPGIVIPFILPFNHFSRGMTNDSFAEMFRMARGKYIAICEGDDFWTDPEKLQVQADFLEAHPDLLFGFEQLTPYFDNTKAYFVGGAPGGSLLDCVDDLMEAIERSNSAQTQYDAFSGMFSEQYNAAVAERQAAEAALKALRESADDYNRQAALTGLSLQDLKYQIERAQEKLDSLTGGSQNQITAKVSGTVSSVAVTAGKTVAKDEVLATIEVPDMGYTLSFSVTTDQARRLHPGDSASVTSYDWGSRIEATLSAIKPDPKNPQTNRLLEFDVTGDVSAGAQLTVSIGERSQNYDFVVPNSAIRSDSNGKFIFVIQAKNSPLGNRYFAKRVDVEILAADDNNSAVTGGINYGDYVITTSSAPLKSGDQVRMAEG